MTHFETKKLPVKPDAIAPDGSNVRVLLSITDKGSMAHFELAPNQVSIAVAHHTIDEIWYFLSGKGEMWRKFDADETIVTVERGVCLTIPVGTHFQFRSCGDESLSAIGVSMGVWPGAEEAYPVEGKWQATVQTEKD